MSKMLAMLYAAFAGGLANVQVGADLKLFRGLQNPALTGVVILSTGLAVAITALLAWWAIAGVQVHTTQIAAIPWWAWLGGALQGLTVLAVFLTAGQTGAAVFSALTVTGGALFSLLLDQFGVVGFEQHSITWSRAAGAALLVGGTMLMAL